jgi:hypothetical protein
MSRRIAGSVLTVCWLEFSVLISETKKRKFFNLMIGERGGTRTLDPMIKSHVLYHLSYALTCRAV